MSARLEVLVRLLWDARAVCVRRVAVPGLLALHLGAVLAFFLLMPFSKMIHGFYRFAALIVEEQKRDPAA